MIKISNHRSLTSSRLSKCLGFLISLVCIGVLAACTNSPSVEYMADEDIYATATAANCGCFPYGSFPHGTRTPTASITPTGTWVRPTITRTPTPTLPPRGCDYCTVAPNPTRDRNWPPPIITCTPNAGEPTITPLPTFDRSTLLPQWPPTTALPAVVGNTGVMNFSSLEGESVLGSVATDVASGQPYVVWSQFNDQEDYARVYFRTIYSGTATWSAARSVNPPGDYRIERTGPESAVTAGNGKVYVAYIRKYGNGAAVEVRSSIDQGMHWDDPVTLSNPGVGATLSLRMLMDDRGFPHIAAIAKRGDECGDVENGCGDIVYFELGEDGTWRSQGRPVSGSGERQHIVAMNLYSLPDGTVRTLLGWREDNKVFTAYKDGIDGAWSRPAFHIDGDSHPFGLLDYWPGYTGMNLITFEYAGQRWVYLFWSLYSTGRIAFVYSSDGGVTWSAEDAMAWNAPVTVPPQPPVYGSGYEPIPFWDAAHSRIFVAYRFRDRETGIYAPAYAYGRPGEVGEDWVGYLSNTTQPLRLFPTANNTSRNLRGSDQHGGGTSTVYMLWIENTGSRELYMGIVSLSTLLSGQVIP